MRSRPREGFVLYKPIKQSVNHSAMAKGNATETRPRDADRSQKDILDAALAEFAEHGLGGARMDRIAERAGVNKRLIYYYFENKESLFLAVLERAYEDIRGEEQQLNLTAGRPGRGASAG